MWAKLALAGILAGMILGLIPVTKSAEPPTLVKAYAVFEGRQMYGLIAIYSDGSTRTFTSQDDPALVKEIILGAPKREAITLPVPSCNPVST